MATAGHVDHGKSTLVRALTGVDPDRFAEEQERGLTIDLGFAAMTLPSGRSLSFVDVPGHVRFLKNMLAGVGAVRTCLFVVAATEGWKPQSEEHLRILDLLGIDRGVVALTKVGLVDDDRRTLARLEVGERLATSPLAAAEVIEVDAIDGTGLGALRLALDRLTLDHPGPARAGTTGPDEVDDGRARLWIDRSFAIRGAGTVVTGTLAGGPLAVDDELVIVPRNTRARIRSLQTHGAARVIAEPGDRVAVNLSGISHEEVGRGDALVVPGAWHQTRTVDASLEVLAGLDHAVSRRGAHVAYLGSGEHAVRLRILGDESLPPGGRGLVRMHLPVTLPLQPGDRYVLRDSGRQETIGGGEILDVDPVVPAARARPDRSVDRVVAERGWIEVDELTRRTGTRRPATVGRWVVDPEVLQADRARVRALVVGAGSLGLDVAALEERQRAVLDGVDDIWVEQGRATIGPPTAPRARHPFVVALEASPFTPPPPTGVDRAELAALVRQGLIVEADGIYFAAATMDRAADLIAVLLAQPAAQEAGGVTVGQIREAFASSRKYTIPLLGLLDASGRTRRRGDLRIAGPRLLAHRPV